MHRSLAVGGVAIAIGSAHPELPTRQLDEFDVDTVADAVEATHASVSLIFVPPPFAADAILEAADAGVGVAAEVAVVTTPAEMRVKRRRRRTIRKRPPRP